MAQPTNQTPVPVEDRLGLVPGTLLRRLKESRMVFGYPMGNLNLEPNKAYPIQRWEINPEELFLYVRRESGKAWVIFIPRIEKNLLVFNRAFWKGAEVISQPEGDSGEKAKESG